MQKIPESCIFDKNFNPEKRMETHRAPWECSFRKEEKSRCMPGAIPKSDTEYFEVMSLCILQAGLSWGTVRKIWPKLKKGFDQFDIEILSMKNPAELLKNPNIIKNPKKVAGLIENAQKFKTIRRNYRSFYHYLETLKTSSDKGAIKRLANDFKHLGEYSAEYFLHSIGYWK